ncbi:alpha-amylase family glycosyl hydrolase [Orenia marismortui]|uniref:Glycosidase n=1 Tax=Orenia marismortui TaxID=46469 RepID=A0A4R8H0C4_9FIRM|nr:alpha-amylase family glycosyl hydrolase [Orenia marismortui]TDX52731.1 glycosidase [Orenia marismortui]
MRKMINSKKIILLSILILSLGLFVGCDKENTSEDIAVEAIKNVMVNVKVPSDSAIEKITVSLRNTDMEEYIASKTEAVSDIDENGLLSFPFSDLKGNTYNVIAKAESSKEKDLYIASATIIDSTSITVGADNFSKIEKRSDFNNLRIYEIMVEAFRDGEPGGYGTGYGPSHHNGDLRGIINSLEYIKGLGVNAIWMTPIFDSKTGLVKGQATGYFPDDFYNVDPKFGSNEDLRELVDKAHELGLYVFMDGVFGHHGSDPIEGVVDYDSQWYGNKVKYPESLEYFKDVATYWIEEYEIDGWRLDQAFQMNQGGTNYLYDIRKAVEEVCEERKARGEEWGTLGYLVGEIWDGSGKEINSIGYSQDGLKSLFDFPLRYSLVQVLASQEDTSVSYGYNQPVSKLNGAYGYGNHKQYPDDAQPNLMLTTHDVVRFGDLIQRAPHLGYGKEHPDYWKRHKAAFSFMASYTGPITIYYGDEIGREVEGFINEQDIVDGEKIYDDHAARDSAKVAGFTPQEKDLKNYLSRLMKMRDNNPALWNGERTNLIAGKTRYADLKVDPDTGDRIVYVLNAGTSETTISVSNVGGSKLVDLLTGEEIIGSGSYDIPVDALTGRFLSVR